MRKAFVNQLIEMAKDDPSVWFLTADLGYSFLERFEHSFPKRFVNVGVAEQNLIGIATGLALSGKKVFVYSIINFLVLRAFDQIRNGINYHNLDVTLVGVGEGFSYGSAGYSHHGVEDLNLIASLENFQIYTPGSVEEIPYIMEKIQVNKRPKYLRLGKHKKSLNLEVTQDLQILKNGNGILIIGYGGLIDQKFVNEFTAFDRVKILRLNTVKPLPITLIKKEASGYNEIIILEEHAKSLISFEIEEILKTDNLSAKVHKISVKKPIVHTAGTVDDLRELSGISDQMVIKTVKEIQQRFKLSICQ